MEFNTTRASLYNRLDGSFPQPREFSPAERILLYILVGLCVASITGIFSQLYSATFITSPARGGTLEEGIIGSPRFINPVLAASQADRDLSALTHAGLMRLKDAQTLEPALAESYHMSPDGLTYEFTLRDEAHFHDGSPIRADDVVFTIERIQDPAVKSPLFVHWEGVTVEKVDDRMVRFYLKAPYAPFLFNTTVGIMPKKVWEHAEPEEMPFSTLNTTPVGSGPFRVVSVERDRSGIPIQYTLRRFEDFAPAPAFVDSINISVFSNETELITALREGAIDSAGGVSPRAVLSLNRSDLTVHTSPLPRIFAVFFNQNANPLFANKTVRAALSRAIPKENIVERVLFGFGDTLESPVPPVFDAAESTSADTESVTGEIEAERLADAGEIMRIGGWERGEDGVWTQKKKNTSDRLAFSLATSNTPELEGAADEIVRAWQAFGAEVTRTVFEPTDLAREVIRPRKYEALFFGEVIGRDLDLYPFWHSSQRNDPGLNVALYTNISADGALETLRSVSEGEDRREALQIFLREVKVDVPAAFVFSPHYLYVAPTALHAISLTGMENGEDRFARVHEWYMETDHIWPFIQEVF